MKSVGVFVVAAALATTMAACKNDSDKAAAGPAAPTAGNDIFVIEEYPSGPDTVYQRAIDGAASISSGTVAKVGGVGDEAGWVARAQTLCVHQGTKNLCLVGGGEKGLVGLARKALPRM